MIMYVIENNPKMESKKRKEKENVTVITALNGQLKQSSPGKGNLYLKRMFKGNIQVMTQSNSSELKVNAINKE